MTRKREKWQKVLDFETERWSSMPCEQLGTMRCEPQVYEVELDSDRYQVEVEILEDTGQYLHVMVSVDDGSLPASFLPLTRSFVCQKTFPGI